MFSGLTRAMRVHVVPLFTDNYAYIVADKPEPVLDAVKKLGVNLTHVLTTHHHNDHAGGNEGMAKAMPALKICGSAVDHERIPAITEHIENGMEFAVGSLHIKAFFTPCHTRNHLLYLVHDKEDSGAGQALFTGDTLFVGGCGRFFEGDAKQMHHALNEVVASFDDDTHVYVGHEYTVKNLKFALTVEPENTALQARLAWAEQCRAADKPTVPTTVKDEKATNPFMRAATESVQRATNTSNAVDAMAAVRAQKDSWTG